MSVYSPRSVTGLSGNGGIVLNGVQFPHHTCGTLERPKQVRFRSSCDDAQLDHGVDHA